MNFVTITMLVDIESVFAHAINPVNANLEERQVLTEVLTYVREHEDWRDFVLRDETYLQGILEV